MGGLKFAVLQNIKTRAAKPSVLGKVSFIEALRDVPFEIGRVYYSYGVEPGGVRGGHAHKALRQFLVCVNGTIEVFLDDGLGRTETFVLNTPEKGLFLGPGLWHTMRWIERDSILLVLASDHYDESDYIRDYDTFVSRMKSLDGRRLQ